MREFDPRLNQVVENQPYPLLFVTISGAHLYGFESPDSDFDLRGVHVLPAEEVVGLGSANETIERMHDPALDGDLDLDLVSHDIKKFMLLMLKKNGYVLEQLFSPLILHTTPEHEELKELGRGCITRHHSHHYLGFANTQWGLFQKENAPRVKPLLYVYRVLLTGIHLMRTGELEANLRILNDTFKLSYIDDLIAQKATGHEKQLLASPDLAFHSAEVARLEEDLRRAHEASSLPDASTARDGLNDLLVRIRLRKG